MEKQILKQKFLNKQTMLEMLRFGITGGVCFLIDFGIMMGLIHLAGFSPVLSTTISFCVSVVINYWICLKWVFKADQKQSPRATFLFFATSLVGVGLNAGIMWLMNTVMGVNEMIVKVIATGIVMIWNYFTKRLTIERTT